MSFRPISPDMTLLDAVHHYPNTESVFRAKDKQAGECILCKALFETIEAMTIRYGLDLEELIFDLEQASRENCTNQTKK